MSVQQDHLRRTQALEAQIGSHAGQIKGLQNTVADLPVPIALSDIPAWEVTRQDTGTFTPGVDWASQFDHKGISNRIIHSHRTAGGELPHVNSDSHAVRARIRFTAQGKGTLNLKLGIVGTGRVQVKANGLLAEYTAGAWITVNQIRSPLTNELVVMSDGTSGAFQFSLDGQLFDGVNRRWASY